MESPELDQLALALVVALHNSDHAAVASLLSDLDWDDLTAVVVVLAAALDAAWVEACEIDDVDFTEFVRESGIWLAEMEEQ